MIVISVYGHNKMRLLLVKEQCNGLETIKIWRKHLFTSLFCIPPPAHLHLQKHTQLISTINKGCQHVIEIFAFELFLLVQ